MSQLESLQSKLQSLSGECEKAFQLSENRDSLYQVKVQFLGKSGQITLLMKEMGRLDPSQRPAFGAHVNEVKSKLELLYESRNQALGQKELEAKLESSRLDTSLPGPRPQLGNHHPLWQMTLQFTEIMEKLGYSLELGPLIESDFYNFEALNIPPHHPARDMQDTFFVDDHFVLRTQTSPIWSRALAHRKPPFRLVGTGAVFRVDSDASHLPHFHQFEGVLIDKKVSLADLKGTVGHFVRELFGKEMKTRFRPSYFPFTEPSAEVDCTCPVCSGSGCSLCKGTGWIEIGGCGLINPEVFKRAGFVEKTLDSTGVPSLEWEGFAFGFGLERMAMIRYGIPDIRDFPLSDPRFVEQFGRFGVKT